MEPAGKLKNSQMKEKNSEEAFCSSGGYETAAEGLLSYIVPVTVLLAELLSGKKKQK